MRHARIAAHRPAVPRPVALPLLAVIVLGMFATACSSKAATTTSTASAPTVTSAAPTSTSVPTSSTLPVTASDRTGIASAYMTLFDLANPAIPPKLAAVQDGTTLKAAFTAALKSALAKEAGGARVLAIVVEGKAACSANSLPSPCALVTYDVLSPGKQTLLKNQTGYAVSSSGHWLVSKKTICTLLSLANGGAAPAGC